jgi:hypothetical protein
MGVPLTFPVSVTGPTSGALTFTYAHGLGKAPLNVQVTPTSQGAITLVSPYWDATYVYLQASGYGLTALLTISPLVAPSTPTNVGPAYATVASVTNLARVYVNDTFKGATGTPGEGRNFIDSGPFMVPLINEALNQLQRDLETAGVTTLRKEAIVYSIPAVDGANGAGVPDPAAQQSLGFAGLYDGSNLWTNIVLPPDTLTPVRLWQRSSGTGLPFTDFPECTTGLISRNQDFKLGEWEWRGDAIYWNGALVPKDVRIRYTAQAGTYTYVWQPSWSYALGALILDSSNHVWQVTTAGISGAASPSWPSSPSSGATVTDGTVTWTYQSGATVTTIFMTWRLPFMDAQQAIAAYMAATFAQSRLPDGAVNWLLAKYAGSLQKMVGRSVRAKQHAPVERVSFGDDSMFWR